MKQSTPSVAHVEVTKLLHLSHCLLGIDGLIVFDFYLITLFCISHNKNSLISKVEILWPDEQLLRDTRSFHILFIEVHSLPLQKLPQRVH